MALTTEVEPVWISCIVDSIRWFCIYYYRVSQLLVMTFFGFFNTISGLLVRIMTDGTSNCI